MAKNKKSATTTTNETPVNETPVNETPVNETPVNETPVHPAVVAFDALRQLLVIAAGETVVAPYAVPTISEGENPMDYVKRITDSAIAHESAAAAARDSLRDGFLPALNEFVKAHLPETVKASVSTRGRGKIDEATRARVEAKLRADSAPVAVIANECGVSAPWVQNLKKSLGLVNSQ